MPDIDLWDPLNPFFTNQQSGSPPSLPPDPPGDPISKPPIRPPKGRGKGGSGGANQVAFQGAIVSRTAAVAYNSNTPDMCPWNEVLVDTDGLANLGTHPTRLTIPNGWTRVRVMCIGYLDLVSSSAAHWSPRILKNGSSSTPVYDWVGPVSHGAYSDERGGGPIIYDIPVTGGNYLEVGLRANDSTAEIEPESVFCVERLT
jgi:hypothetical protein